MEQIELGIYYDQMLVASRGLCPAFDSARDRRHLFVATAKDAEAAARHFDYHDKRCRVPDWTPGNYTGCFGEWAKELRQFASRLKAANQTVGQALSCAL